MQAHSASLRPDNVIKHNSQFLQNQMLPRLVLINLSLHAQLPVWLNRSHKVMKCTVYCHSHCVSTSKKGKALSMLQVVISDKKCICICRQKLFRQKLHKHMHAQFASLNSQSYWSSHAPGGIQDTSQQALLLSHPFAQNSVIVAASNYSALLFFSPGTS